MEVAARGPEPRDHVLHVYAADRDVIDDAAAYLLRGFAEDAAVVTIADEPHRDALTRRLGEHGIDLDAAAEAGRYRCLDATRTLSALTVGGVPSRDRFREIVGATTTAAAAGGRPVRVFGEMVALEWASGATANAIRLESLWDDIARRPSVSLYCAYHADVLTRSGELALVQQVCAHHSSVVPPTSYALEANSAIEPGTHGDADTYLPVPAAVPAARRLVTEHLRAWGYRDDSVDDAALVVSELAANAVLHARTVFRVSVLRSDPVVRIVVEDLCPDLPAVGRGRARPGIGGRGLLLVDAISRRWGTEPESRGKRVWSEIVCATEQGEQ